MVTAIVGNNHFLTGTQYPRKALIYVKKHRLINNYLFPSRAIYR